MTSYSILKVRLISALVGIAWPVGVMKGNCLLISLNYSKSRHSRMTDKLFSCFSMSVMSHSGTFSGAPARAGINKVGWGGGQCIATGWLLYIYWLSSSLLAKQAIMKHSSTVYIVTFIVLYE